LDPKSGRYVIGAICLVGMLLAPLSLRVWPRSPLTLDYRLMWEEFESAGGIKFFSKTEELLRLAEFEEALLRYRFLKGQVAGLAAYRPLVLDIDRRLHFLQRQLHLSEADIQALPRQRVRSRPRARAPKTILPKPKTEVTTSLESGPTSSSTTPRETPALIPPVIIPTTTMTQKSAMPGSAPTTAESPQPPSAPTEAPAPGPESTEPASQAESGPEEAETPSPTPAPPQKSFMGWLKSFF